MFAYKIKVGKHDVQFEAHTVGLEPLKSFTDTLSHIEAPSRIRAIYAKVSENQEEQEFLYQATKMFKASTITIS